MRHKAGKENETQTKHTGRNIVIAVVVVLAAFCAYAAALVHSAMVIKDEVTQSVGVVRDSGIGAALAGSGQDSSMAGMTAIEAVAPQLQQHTTVARGQADGWVWRSASMLPVIGNDFAATRIATDALDTLASDVLPSLTDAANTMQKAGLANADGNLNVKTLTEVSSKISKSNDTLQRQVTALNEAPEPHIAQVRDALTSGKATLDSAASQINGVASTLDSLAALFGHEGTRNYLILSQTNAETQAAGGVVGSVGTLTVNNGTISMGQFYSDSKFDLTAPVTSTDEVDKLYAISRLGVSYGGDIRLASATPNFPAAAQYAKEVWARQSFGSNNIDGVLSFDTVALQSLLGVTGPITLSSGKVTLTAQNTAQYLSNQVYIDITDQNAQDAFFEESAQRIINGMLSGLNAHKALSLVATMPKLTEHRHVYMWSFDKSDQKVLKKAGVVGEPGTDAQNPVTGVYVNEMGWTKTDWYMKKSATVSKTADNKDGSSTYHVTYTTTNTMTADQSTKLPAYITGTFPLGMMSDLVKQSGASDEEKAAIHAAMESLSKPGVVGHSIAIAKPVGGSVSNITVTSDSKDQIPALQSDFMKIKAGSTTYYANIACLLSPGATFTVEYDVKTAPHAAQLQLDQTPTNNLAAQVTYTDSGR